MHIALINPNTTHSMTERMRDAAMTILSNGVELTALTASYGAPSIEGYYDEDFAIPPMIEALGPMADRIDGVVVVVERNNVNRTI